MTSINNSSSCSNNNNINTDPDGMLRLRIKSNVKDVEIAVPATSVVAHVKQQVRAALSSNDDEDDNDGHANNQKNSSRYLRLICKGRLLLPDDHPITDFNVQNNDVVHAVLATVPQTTTKDPSAEEGSITTNHGGIAGTPHRRPRRHRRPRHVGTVVGPGGRVTRAPVSLEDSLDDESSSEDDDDDYDDVGDGDGGDVELGGRRHRRPRQRYGFDRLRLVDNGIVPMALPRSEVSAIRAYFSRHVDRYMAQHPGAHGDESDAVRRRHLYEQDWMNQQGPASEFRLNLNQNTLLRLANLQQSSLGLRGGGGGIGGVGGASNVYGSISVGTDRDFMWGFMLGFFVGFVMLVWVWMPTVPHKQKIGILTGISFQLAMNVFSTNPNDALEELEDGYEGVDGEGSEDLLYYGVDTN